MLERTAAALTTDVVRRRDLDAVLALLAEIAEQTGRGDGVDDDLAAVADIARQTGMGLLTVERNADPVAVLRAVCDAVGDVADPGDTVVLLACVYAETGIA